MSWEPVTGGVAAGALSLPLLFGADAVGGPLAAVLVLCLVVLGGWWHASELDSETCRRCGAENAREDAVCSECQAQL